MGKNPIIHWEIMGADGNATAAFYGKVFDWAPQAWSGFEGYHGIDAEHGGIGGAVGKGSDDMPAYVTVYIGVDDIDEHMKKIAAAGGSTVLPRTVIPGVVAFGMFRDPAGNVVGLAEHETPAAG
jgi:hypothetical protein